ncbi:MAG TPA: ATP-binding cassette domain-containing protein [Dongiaceae bacterium]|nr:ATP-binding cassette domain-containing protein [Dongiaceae bacterium]
MAGDTILDLDGMRSRQLAGAASGTVIDLKVGPGELILIDARDADLGRGFADICCGLIMPDAGDVAFLGRQWHSLPHLYADALRGRIGRVFAGSSWISHLDAATNILLPQLHHTRREPAELRAEAAELCRHFGLPGLPTGAIASLSDGDRVRAGFVRAVLGEPMLLLLESPVQGLYADVVPMLLNCIAAARDRGAAAIWMTRSKLVWSDRTFPATQRLRLGYHGLSPVRGNQG